MGKFLIRLEQKYGKYALNNLPMAMVVCYALGFIVQNGASWLMEYLYLNPYLVMKGQIWRLFTWIFVPLGSSNILMELFAMYCYYMLAKNLEFAMGRFRFGLYIFSGVFFTMLGGFVLFGIAGVQFADVAAALGEGGWYDIFTVYGTTVIDGEQVLLPAVWFRMISTNYIYMSMLLAFAAIFPQAVFRINFLIPIKAKWLGIVYAVIIGYEFLMSDMVSRVIILASLLNFLLFFFATRDYRRVSPKEFKRKAEYHQKVRQAQQAGNSTVHQGRNVITRHKCAICGRTELDDENLEFRFCSKCEGNFEYCMDHLYTHEHVKRIVPGGTAKKPEE